MFDILNKMFAKFGLVNFYFFPHEIVNYTTCVNICHEKGMNLPNVNDFETIRDVAAKKPVFHQQANRNKSAELFLTYFIGRRF